MDTNPPPRVLRPFVFIRVHSWFNSCLVVAMWWLATLAAPAQTSSGVATGFCRIVRGWTHYSTAFNATHDLGADGDFATVASFYTPPTDTRPLDYGVIVIWLGSGSQRLDFARFDFRVSIWGSVDAFRQDPRQGDVATFAFASPSGGSTTVPDTTTLGGRPAYELRFSLTNAALTLTQCQTYLIGFAARARVQQDGEIYVPTAPTEGPSDAQAGSLVPFGFNYLISAGGLTLYSGQVATELLVQVLGPRPTLSVRLREDAVQVSWPARGGCYTLEAADEPGAASNWLPVTESPQPTNGVFTVSLPTAGAARFFRLVQ